MAVPAKIKKAIARLLAAKPTRRAFGRLSVLCDDDASRWNCAVELGLEARFRPLLHPESLLDDNTVEQAASTMYLVAAALADDHKDVFINERGLQLMAYCLKQTRSASLLKMGGCAIGNLTDAIGPANAQLAYQHLWDPCQRIVQQWCDLEQVEMATRVLTHVSARLETGQPKTLSKWHVPAAVKMLERGRPAGAALLTLVLAAGGVNRQHLLCAATRENVQALVALDGHWLYLQMMVTTSARLAGGAVQLVGSEEDGAAVACLQRRCPPSLVRSAVQLVVDSALLNRGLGVGVAAQAVCWLLRLRREPPPLHGYNSAAQMAVLSGRMGSLQVVLDSRGDVHQATPGLRFTPLMLAVMLDRADMVSALVPHGGLDAECAWDATALELAAFRGRAACMQALLDAGASRGCSLHIAASRGGTSCVRLLLQRGAPPDEYRDHLGTPLALAVANEHWKVASLLRGADMFGKPYLRAVLQNVRLSRPESVVSD